MTSNTAPGEMFSAAESDAKSSLWGNLKHAFAVDTDSNNPITEKQIELVEQIGIKVVQRRMAIPAITMLEMCRPLNYLGSQLLRASQPLVALLAKIVSRETATYEEIANLLERRDSIDMLIDKIEELELKQNPDHLV